MSLQPPDSPTLDQTEEEQAAIKALVDKYAKSNLHDAPDDSTKASENDPSAPRPMRIYTREQLLYLYRSPLVQLPPHMPELKQWFGFVVALALLLFSGLISVAVTTKVFSPRKTATLALMAEEGDALWQRAFLLHHSLTFRCIPLLGSGGTPMTVVSNIVLIFG
jgi:hypothetical protein